MTKRAFGELEQSILHIMGNGGRLTVKDVHAKLGGHDKYNTIMTVMNRMTEKKQLSRERVGLQYQYWVDDILMKSNSFLSQLKQRIFGVKTSTMVNYLIEEADDISVEDLDQMEKLIKKAREGKLGGNGNQ